VPGFGRRFPAGRRGFFASGVASGRSPLRPSVRPSRRPRSARRCG